MSRLSGLLTGIRAGVPGEVPVVPDRETARRWAEDELLDPIYDQRPSLVDRVVQWFYDLFEGAEVAGVAVDPGLAGLIVLGGLVLVVLVALFVAGPVRRQRAQRTSAVVLGDDVRSAAQLRRAADDHASAGRWAAAVLDRFRAIVRSLEERALLDERPGRTAREAALDASERLPEHRAELHRASRLFDDVCYGKAATGPGDDAWLRELDQRLSAARPTAPALAGVSGAAAGPDRAAGGEHP